MYVGYYSLTTNEQHIIGDEHLSNGIKLCKLTTFKVLYFSGEALNQSYFLFLVPIGILGNALSFMASIVILLYFFEKHVIND